MNILRHHIKSLLLFDGDKYPSGAFQYKYNNIVIKLLAEDLCIYVKLTTAIAPKLRDQAVLAVVNIVWLLSVFGYGRATPLSPAQQGEP